jgi:hypothetical protein
MQLVRTCDPQQCRTRFMLQTSSHDVARLWTGTRKRLDREAGHTTGGDAVTEAKKRLGAMSSAIEVAIGPLCARYLGTCVESFGWCDSSHRDGLPGSHLQQSGSAQSGHVPTAEGKRRKGGDDVLASHGSHP